MIAHITKSLSIGLALALAFGGLPKSAESQDFPFPKVVRRVYPQAYQPQVTYMPQATYMPPVDYQSVCCQVPVTTYCPILPIDPSTGYQVTYLQPVTAMQWQPQQEPYMANLPILPKLAPSAPAIGSPTPTMYPVQNTSSESSQYTIVTSTNRIIAVDNRTRDTFELQGENWKKLEQLPH